MGWFGPGGDCNCCIPTECQCLPYVGVPVFASVPRGPLALKVVISGITDPDPFYWVFTTFSGSTRLTEYEITGLDSINGTYLIPIVKQKDCSSYALIPEMTFPITIKRTFIRQRTSGCDNEDHLMPANDEFDINAVLSFLAGVNSKFRASLYFHTLVDPWIQFTMLGTRSARCRDGFDFDKLYEEYHPTILPGSKVNDGTVMAHMLSGGENPCLGLSNPPRYMGHNIPYQIGSIDAEIIQV